MTYPDTIEFEEEENIEFEKEGTGDDREVILINGEEVK